MQARALVTTSCSSQLETRLDEGGYHGRAVGWRLLHEEIGVLRGVRVTEHHHAESVADVNEVNTRFIEQPGHGKIVSGKRRDFFATGLHAADGLGRNFHLGKRWAVERLNR